MLAKFVKIISCEVELVKLYIMTHKVYISLVYLAVSNLKSGGGALGSHLGYVLLLVENFHTENIWRHTESSSDVDSRG